MCGITCQASPEQGIVGVRPNVNGTIQTLTDWTIPATNCDWKLVAPAGCRVELWFEWFELETVSNGDSVDDCRQYVKLWDGDEGAPYLGFARNFFKGTPYCEGAEIGSLMAPSPSDVMRSSGTTVAMRFRTDDLVEDRTLRNGTGFVMRHRAICD